MLGEELLVAQIIEVVEVVEVIKIVEVIEMAEVVEYSEEWKELGDFSVQICLSPPALQIGLFSIYLPEP